MAHVRLRELIDIQSGFAFKSKEYTESGHFLVRIGNVQDRRLSLDKPRYVVLDSKTERFELNEGDYLTSLTGNIGRVARVEKSHLPAALNQRVARITIRDATRLFADYLFYFLSSDFFRDGLSEAGHGVAQKNVSPAAIGDLAIPLPTLHEQKRIVAILDGAFAAIETAIANTEKNLANAQELFENYLTAVMHQTDKSWITKSMESVCDLFQGLAINIGTKHLLVAESTLPLLRIKDLRNGTEEQYVAEVGYPKNAEIFPEDIVYTRTGQIGLVFRGRRGVLHNNCFKVVPTEELDCSFLFWFLQEQTFKNEIIRLASRAAQPDITHKLFKAQLIQFPAIPIQKAIAEKIEHGFGKNERLKSILQEKVDLLDDLKASILQKAFSDELTVDAAQEAVT